MLRIQRLGGNLPDLFADAIGVILLDDSDTDKVAWPEMLRNGLQSDAEGSRHRQ